MSNLIHNINHNVYYRIIFSVILANFFTIMLISAYYINVGHQSETVFVPHKDSAQATLRYNECMDMTGEYKRKHSYNNDRYIEMFRSCVKDYQEHKTTEVSLYKFLSRPDRLKILFIIAIGIYIFLDLISNYIRCKNIGIRRLSITLAFIPAIIFMFFWAKEQYFKLDTGESLEMMFWGIIVYGISMYIILIIRRVLLWVRSGFVATTVSMHTDIAKTSVSKKKSIMRNSVVNNDDFIKIDNQKVEVNIDQKTTNSISENESLSWNALTLRIFAAFTLYVIAAYFLMPTPWVDSLSEIQNAIRQGAIRFMSFMIPFAFTSLITVIVAKVLPSTRHEPLPPFLNAALIVATIFSIIMLYFGWYGRNQINM